MPSRNRFAMCLAAVTVGLGVVDSIPAASEPAPPGLTARAESLLVARNLAAESKAGLETLRGRLLAVTDSLETAGVDSLAALGDAASARGPGVDPPGAGGRGSASVLRGPDRGTHRCRDGAGTGRAFGPRPGWL